jgi:hypothetical protein
VLNEKDCRTRASDCLAAALAATDTKSSVEWQRLSEAWLLLAGESATHHAVEMQRSSDAPAERLTPVLAQTRKASAVKMADLLRRRLFLFDPAVGQN